MTDTYAELARESARSFFENQREARAALAVVDPLQMMHRAALDAIQSAMPTVWERRAAILEDARPRPGDYLGEADPRDLAAMDARLASDAARYRMQAALLRGEDLLTARHAADVALCVDRVPRMGSGVAA